MTTSNLIHLSGMIAILGGLISSGEASAPGEAARRGQPVPKINLPE